MVPGGAGDEAAQEGRQSFPEVHAGFPGYASLLFSLPHWADLSLITVALTGGNPLLYFFVPLLFLSWLFSLGPGFGLNPTGEESNLFDWIG